jgi:hypothetical protein
MPKMHETITGAYEEIFHGYEIYVISNPDRWRGGFEWSICKDNCEIESELVFCVDDAIKNAREVVIGLIGAPDNECETIFN